MTEWQNLLRLLKLSHPQPQTAALATLVGTQGSTYRRPGARMIVFPNGERSGSLSGGCLEADVAEHAQRVISSGKAELVRYNSQAGFDLVMEMGCRGGVTLLIEPFSPSHPLVAFIENCRSGRRVGVLGTVFEAEGTADFTLGDHFFFSEPGVCPEAAGFLAEELRITADSVFESQKSVCWNFSEAGKSAAVFFEPIKPPLALLIGGAGEDAAPLARFAGLLGWEVTLFDERSHLVSDERFAKVAHKKVAALQALHRHLAPDSFTAAVVMSHHYEQDKAMLKFFLPSPVRYLGMLGPRKRTEQMLAELETEGQPIEEAEKSRLFFPAGLDLGSETPEEIALSIVAEIQAVWNSRPGLSLKTKNTPIHAPAPEPPA